MYTVCLSYSHNRDVAQDIMHDAFFKVFKKFEQYREGHSLEAWIRTIVVNTAIDHVRRITKFRNVSYEVQHEELTSQDTLINAQKTSDLLKLINMLPVGAKTVFNLHTLEGYKHHEIAEMLGISEGTSKSQFARARLILKDLVDRFYNQS